MAAQDIGLRGVAGLTFDDFEVGDEHWSPGRTVTEADLVQFCMLSGDWNPHHCDDVFAKTTALGQRLAHGALVIAVCSGLVVRTRIFEGTIVALLEWTWRYAKPTLIGTRLQLRIRVKELKPTSNPERGIVTFEVAAIDEADEVAALSEWKILMLTRSGRG